jgi:hypothetical protein
VTDADREGFASTITGMFAYYRQPLSEFTLDVWWNGCQEYALADVRRALTVHTKDPDRGQYLPKLADVERLLGGGATDRGVQAWSIVLAAARDVGAYRDVDFGDAAVHQAIADMGGWPLICRAEVEELRHLQHRFMQALQVFSLRGAPNAPAHLPGDRSADDVYTSRGLKAPQPVRVLSALRAVDAKLLPPGPTLRIGG